MRSESKKRGKRSGPKQIARDPKMPPRKKLPAEDIADTIAGLRRVEGLMDDFLRSEPVMKETGNLSAEGEASYAELRRKKEAVSQAVSAIQSFLDTFPKKT